MSNIQFGMGITCPPCTNDWVTEEATTTTAATTIAQQLPECLPADWPTQEKLMRFGFGFCLMILFLFIIGLSLTKVVSVCRKRKSKQIRDENMSGGASFCLNTCIHMHGHLSHINGLYKSNNLTNRSSKIQNLNIT